MSKMGRPVVFNKFQVTDEEIAEAIETAFSNGKTFCTPDEIARHINGYTKLIPTKASGVRRRIIKHDLIEPAMAYGHYRLRKTEGGE